MTWLKTARHCRKGCVTFISHITFYISQRIENAENENQIILEETCKYDRDRKNPGCQKFP
jgi:hypothetical protein